MAKQSNPLEFLVKAQTNPKISARVLAALERGNKVMAEEVLQIAKEFGYSFTQSQFENEVKKAFKSKFDYEELEYYPGLPREVARRRPRPRPPMSTCPRGCVSWTTNWHPAPPTKPT